MDTRVFALAATIPVQAVVGDNVAYNVAKRMGVSCTRTLTLLCESILEGLLTLDAVGNVADGLIATEYRLPFGPGEFAEWAVG